MNRTITLIRTPDKNKLGDILNGVLDDLVDDTTKPVTLSISEGLNRKIKTETHYGFLHVYIPNRGSVIILVGIYALEFLASMYRSRYE